MLHVCVGKDAADRETDLELDLGADLELDLDLKCRVWTVTWSLEAANYILLQDIKSYYYIFTSTSQQRSTDLPTDQPANRPPTAPVLAVKHKIQVWSCWQRTSISS